MGRFGAWLMKEMLRHTPKETAKSLVKQEGDLDLGLEHVSAGTLLLHATTDADVPCAPSEHAKALLPHAELVTITDGTPVSVWTDPDAKDHQDRIASFLVLPWPSHGDEPQPRRARTSVRWRGALGRPDQPRA